MSGKTKGILYLIASAFFFALMAVFIRLAGDINFMQKGFFRNAVAFLIALASILIEVKKSGKASVSVPKKSWPFLVLRALGGTIGIFANFYAIDKIPLADAAILNKMSPFFAILFSFILLREKIKPIPLIAIIVAFLGSILVIKPTFNFSQFAPSFIAFVGGIGAGFAYACVRKLSIIGCNGKFIILFFSAFSMLCCLPYMLVSFDPMSWKQLLYLCATGICGAAGQFTITAAYYHAPARDISIYDYSQIIFSTLLGLIFFGQLPDVWSFVGYAIIISMAILNFVYGKKRDKIAA
ncbi:MAG: DMT family transporter [Treponemataceae bacterium]|nr:DMT family transporter [Treponemataceae bacterium]